MRNSFVDIAACSLVGAAVLYGLASARPLIAQMKQGESPSVGHVFAADLVSGPLGAIFSADGGADEAQRSSSHALRANLAGGRDAENAGGDGGAATGTAAESADAHATSVDLISLNPSVVTPPYGRGISGDAYDFPSVGLSSTTQAFGGAPPFGGGATAGSGSDMNLNALADGASVAPVKAAPSAAPEPSTWALMLVGVGLSGSALRRRWSRHDTGRLHQPNQAKVRAR